MFVILILMCDRLCLRELICCLCVAVGLFGAYVAAETFNAQAMRQVPLRWAHSPADKQLSFVAARYQFDDLMRRDRLAQGGHTHTHARATLCTVVCAPSHNRSIGSRVLAAGKL